MVKYQCGIYSENYLLLVFFNILPNILSTTDVVGLSAKDVKGTVLVSMVFIPISVPSSFSAPWACILNITRNLFTGDHHCILQRG